MNQQSEKPITDEMSRTKSQDEDDSVEEEGLAQYTKEDLDVEPVEDQIEEARTDNIDLSKTSSEPVNPFVQD